MKKTYTKKLISEAIAYWKTQLNEATRYEMEIAKNIKQILVNAYGDTLDESDIKLVANGYYGSKTLFDLGPQPAITIFASGKSNTSDIYILLNNKETGATKEIGIEVKSNSGSSMFNPQLNYMFNTVAYTNDLFNKLFSSSEASDVIEQCRSEYMAFINKMLDPGRSTLKSALDAIISTNVCKQYDVTSFPFRLKPEDRPAFLKLLKAELLSNPDFPSAMIDKSLKYNRLFLCQYTINDNDIIKAYFNKTRKYKDSLYRPVQYILYDGNLYCIDSDCHFFTANNPKYKVSNYDNEFTGLKFTWYLDFSNKKSDNFIRIKGYVKAFVKNDASLDDPARLPGVNDDGFFG